MPSLSRIPRKIVDNYELNFLSRGEEGFYKYILGSSIISKQERPDVDLLDQSGVLFSMARTTGNDNYFNIGIILRRAAHRLYRFKNKEGNDPRFLRMVHKK